MSAGLTNRSPFTKAGIAGTVAIVLVSAVWAATSLVRSARSATTFGYSITAVPLGGAVGGLYQPTTASANESIAFVFTHEDANTITNRGQCGEMASRGFTALCIKSEFGQQAQATWDALALDIAGAVKYLHTLSTVKKVVLVGYSGGGAIMSYYQNVAEHGVSVCQAPERLDPCSNKLAGMPPADGVVLLDSIPGIAFSDLSALDASVVNEQNLRAKNPSLDMYDAGNGFNDSGSSSYSSAFVDKYTAAQGAREANLVAAAQGLLDQAAQGKGQYSNDAPFPVGRLSARIWEADSDLISHTQDPHPLITPSDPEATAPPHVVQSVRVPSADPAGNEVWDPRKGGFSASTFLSIAAIRAPAFHVTDDSITGVDWGSTNTATVSNVAGISSPLLIMSMTGHYWVVPSEMYYDAATSASDKTLVYVYRVTHGMGVCTQCPDPLNQGNSFNPTNEINDYLANWATTHVGV